MAIFKNISKKIISVNGIAVMPDESTEIPDSYADLPGIKAMENAGRVIVMANPAPAPKPAVKEPEEKPAVEEPKEAPAEVEEEAPKKRRTKKKTEEEESKAVEEALAKEIFG